MSTSVGSIHPVSAPVNKSVGAEQTDASLQANAVPWYIWWGVLGVTSSTIGAAWDVAWHRSIGRDSFLTPAHLAIYACGVIAAVICAYLIFATTFGNSSGLRDVSVNVLGFRAPLGAFVAAWGGIATLTSAPFDNWWHNAYGLDAKIVSPPHTLLIFGVRGVSFGVMFLILAAMNRARDQSGRARTFTTLQMLFLYLGGLTVFGQMFFLTDRTLDFMLHWTFPYVAMGVALPVVFAMLSRASGHRWAATIAAVIYMACNIAEVLIFPLFPASPKLGPVFYPVTHLVPANFPILLIFPALALDLLWQRTAAWRPWAVAAISGVVFLAVLFVAEWPFASFLLSKASENRFFGTIYFDYASRPDGPARMRQFVETARGTVLARGLATASLYAMIGTWIGLRFGGWMKTVLR